MKSFPLLLILAPAAALAVSPFDGTWKIRSGSYHTSYQFVFSVDEKEYRCSSCKPPVIVKPDGRFHKVSGHEYDNVAVRIVDPLTVEVIQRAGEKVILKDTHTVSRDNLQLHTTRIDETGEKPDTMEAVLKRSAGSKPEQGKHPLSGSWMLANADTSGLPMVLRMTEDGFSSSWNGQHYEAKFDGRPVPEEGDPTHEFVTVRRVGANAVEETYTRDGKPTYKILYSVVPDGKSLQVTETNGTDYRAEYVMDKQP